MTKAQIMRKIKIFPSFFYRIGLKNKDFTIISNNCWGGWIYDRYSLCYNTPTIGLWFTSTDYLKFISNLKYYLNQELIEIRWFESSIADLLKEREKKYIDTLGKDINHIVIAKLLDINIVFLHYRNFEEAREKWTRRKKRINYNNLLVKFNDQNGFKFEDFETFDKLNYKNKIFITANSNFKSKSNTKIVYIDRFKNNGYVIDDMKMHDYYFDIKKYLNTLTI